MNAAFAALLAERDFDTELDSVEDRGKAEKFRMAHKHHIDKRNRPKQHNGMHRRRRKKIRL